MSATRGHLDQVKLEDDNLIYLRGRGHYKPDTYTLGTYETSVLTRILPWGVPGPPLLRNRGPVRTSGGQSYKKHAVRRT